MEIFNIQIPSLQQAAVNAAVSVWSARPELVDYILNRRVERARLMRLAGIVAGAMQRAREAGDAAEVNAVRALQTPVMDSLSALNLIDGYIDRGIAEAKRRGWITQATVDEVGLSFPPVILALAIVAVVLGVAVVAEMGITHARAVEANERIRVREIEARVAQGLPVDQSAPESNPTDKAIDKAGEVVKTIAIVGSIGGALFAGFKWWMGRNPS